MRRVAGLFLAAVALTLSAPGHAADRRPPMRFASPGKAIAAEVAFARLAQRKGQWTAFRETAAEDAVMFTPRPVNARDYLRGRKDPPASLTWQPHQTWLSCDGSLAVNTGPWQRPDGTQGYFTTVWQRQKDGEYKWVMDQGDTLSVALEAPEMIRSSVATCDRKPGSPPTTVSTPQPAPALPAGTLGGWSEDRTLTWQIVVAPDCGRALTVSLYRGAGKPMEPVLQKQVPAPVGMPAQTCPAI